MMQELLQEQIDVWEPTAEDGAEVIRTIDTHEDTVERIVKVDIQPEPVRYYLYRYFQTAVAGMRTVVCSVDLNGVEADEVIQHLGERL